MMKCIEVTLVNRACGRFWSIEEIFSNVERHLPNWVKYTVLSAPRGRANWVSVVANLIWFRSITSCDLIHQTGDIHYTILGNWKYPTVLTIHDLRIIEDTRGLKRILLWFFWFYLPCLRADRITVISEFTRGRLLAFCRVAPKKVSVIPDCVGQGFIATERCWPLGCVRLLQVGTTDNKNILRVAEACAGLPIELVVLGKVTDLQRQAFQQFSITFTNFIDLARAQVVSLYQECDLVVFVSTYEGFGMPIIEAQSIGRPVLTSDLSPMREVAGGGALLVDPFNTASIRAGILRLLQEADLRQKLVAEGFQNVRQYSASAVASQYAAVYREVLGK